MARAVWQSHVGRLLLSVAIYWIASLAVLYVAFPLALDDRGSFAAPRTFLAIGAYVTPMDVLDGFAVPLGRILSYLMGATCLLVAVFFRRWGWAALPGIGVIGGHGAAIFVGAGG
jgi:hypothetical protein